MISGEEIEEILVVACADSIEFKLHTEQKFYEYPIRAPYPKKRPLYVAIYYEGVEHIAKVTSYEVVKYRDIVELRKPYYPNVKDWGDLNEKMIKIGFNRLIELPIKITNPRGQRVTYIYTTFEKLLSAKYIHEL